MEFLYVDESGDNGFKPGSSERFILAGVAVNASRWREMFWKVRGLKDEIFRRYGIRIDEFKASELFSHRGAFFDSRLRDTERTWIYDRLIDLLCDPAIKLFISIHSKAEFRRLQPALEDKYLVKPFTRHLWKKYLFSYEEYLIQKTKRTSRPANAILYFDSNPGQEKLVRGIVREFAEKTGTEERLAAAGLVEDVIFRDSKTSYF